MDVSRSMNPLWVIVEFAANGIKGFCMRFKSRGIIGFQELVEDAFKAYGYDVDDYIKKTRIVQKELKTQLAKGFRVDFGDNFISVQPNPIGAVRDTVDPSTGQVIPANPDNLRSDKAVTKLSVVVAKKFTKELGTMMEWQKYSNKIQDDDDEEDATIDPNENPENIPIIDSSTGSNNNGGGDIPAGNG